MKKLLVGLTLLTSMSSFAITELQFSGYAAKSAYDGMTDVSIKDYGFQKEGEYWIFSLQNPIKIPTHITVRFE